MSDDEEDCLLSENEFLSLLIPFIASDLGRVSYSTRLMEYTALTEKMDVEIENQLPLVLRQHLDQASCPLPLYRHSLTSPPLKIPRSFLDLSYFNDTDFWSFCHISRGVALIIMQNIYDTALKTERSLHFKYHPAVFNVDVDRTFKVVLWYLRNADDPLERGVELFHLLSVDHLHLVLNRGLQLIKCLKEEAMFYWSTAEEAVKTCQHFSKWYKSPAPVYGIMTKYVFHTIKQKRMLLQMVSDENDIVRSAIISNDTRCHIAMRMEPDFLAGLGRIPQGFRIVSDNDYLNGPKRFEDLYLTPSDDLFKRSVRLLDTHKALMRKGKVLLRDLVRRFPRLTKLHVPLPDAFIAALILQNYCQINNEQNPPL